MADRAADTPAVSHLDPPRPGAAAVVLADGEHYPSAVADAVADLVSRGWDIRSVALLGGTEKLRGVPDYGVPHHSGTNSLSVLAAALDSDTPECVIDLADEPVLDFPQRARAIGRIAGRGIRYIGADAVVDPPRYVRVDCGSLAIIGTGKRIGKTAVSAHVARLADTALGSDGSVVVVAMGRGGPAAPVVIDRAGGAVDVDRLLEVSRAGSHAASDYLEDAVLTGLTTVGCRRVGGGLLGVPAHSNVPEGAAVAAALDPALIVFEGSGSCIPPVDTRRTLLLGATERAGDLLQGFGPYRLERADLLLVMGEDLDATAAVCHDSQLLCPGLEAVGVRLRPAIVGSVEGRRVAGFTTAPAHVLPLVEQALLEAGATDVPVVSGALARRAELRVDMQRAVDAGCDSVAVEIKAAAIDVVAEVADQHDLDVVWIDNRPVPHESGFDLDDALTQLALSAAATPAR